MKKILIIAEKPDSGKKIANILGKNLKNKGNYLESEKFIFTWAIGHLLELYMPDDYNKDWKKWEIKHLPFAIKNYKIKPSSNTKSQYNSIKKIIRKKEIGQIINACDSDPEGELIFWEIIDDLNLDIDKYKMKRMWYSSLSKKEIKTAFNNAKPLDQYKDIYESSKSRSIADWIVGINLTRLYTLKLGETFSVGRVQTPTLNFVIKKEKEIKNFKSQNYWNIYATFENIKGILYFDNKVSNNDILEKKKANKILKQIKNQKDCIIEKIEKRKKSIPPKKLYDLKTLQGDANKIYGYTIKETLQIAQRLYEKYNILSYPRTDSRYLKDSQKDEINKILKVAIKNINYINEINLLEFRKENFDDSKVTGHYAIIPTATEYKIEKLTEKEKNIYELVVNRTLSQCLKNYEYENTKVYIKNNNYKFYIKGKKINSSGWRKLDKSLKNQKNNIVPNTWKKDKPLKIKKSIIKEKSTRPSNRYTEKTLQEKMAKNNLGRPSTQADIIEKLKKREYIKSTGKYLKGTLKGSLLIKVVHSLIKKPKITKQMEKALEQIKKGEMNSKTYIQKTHNYVSKVISIEKNKDRIKDKELIKKITNKKKTVGKCPICNNLVLENKGNFFCQSKREKCNFALWKNDKYWKKFNKTITKNRAEKILKNGSIKVANLKGKYGKFTARIKLKITPNKKWNYEWELEKTNRN
ncbi:MAG: DNA topoisomerase [Bacillota bacterium]